MERKTIALAGTLFFVALISFAAGYLANREFSHAPIVIEACSDIARSALIGPATSTRPKENPR